MSVRELMNYLTEFMDNKGKLGTGLGDASVFMQVGGHLEELKELKFKRVQLSVQTQ
jgi:hypothetical protein